MTGEKSEDTEAVDGLIISPLDCKNEGTYGMDGVVKGIFKELFASRKR